MRRAFSIISALLVIAASSGTGLAYRDYFTPEQKAQAADREAARGVTVRGQDLSAETQRRGQDMASATAAAGRAVTLRGQDLSAETARRGQDLTDARAAKTAAGKGGPNAAAIIAKLEDLSGKINTAEGLTAKAGGMIRRGMAAANYDNDVAQYEALVSGMIPMVARALGHTGVLTQQDVDSVRDLFPRPGDSKSLAASKLANVKTLMQSAPADGAAEPDPAAPTPKKKNPFQ